MTRFWLIRHALVEETARSRLYGVEDVPLCSATLAAEVPHYRALARLLPRPATWLCTPLSRTRLTAEAIFAGGYPAQPLTVEPELIEQHLGAFQGLVRTELPSLLTTPPHPFWPIAADQVPPGGGESFVQVVGRVGAAMERLADAHHGQDVVAVSHGGAIRAAVAHALDISARNALHLSVHNISLTRLDREAAGWRVVSVNEAPRL